MQRSVRERRAAFQPSLVVALVTIPFVAGSVVFSWALYDLVACVGARGDCAGYATGSLVLSVLGLALMFLPGLAAVVFALYEAPARKELERWGGLR